MRLPWPAVAGGVAVALVGAAGLVRAAVPQGSGDGGSSAPIVVSGAYVRAPVPPTKNAAAYFTVYNTTGTADRLLSVDCPAGEESVLHTLAPDGSMSVQADGVAIPAHGRLTLATGRGHVMIEQVRGTMRPGERVTLDLDFAHAGALTVTAPVIAVGAPAPTPSGAPQ